MLGNEYANKKKTMYQLEKFHLLLLFLSFACEMSKLSFHKISNLFKAVKQTSVHNLHTEISSYY